jgi:hypothetical protein
VSRESTIDGVEARNLRVDADKRGYLVETVREDWELYDAAPAMSYYSLSHPGVVRVASPPPRAGRPLRPLAGPSRASTTTARALPHDELAAGGVATPLVIRDPNPGTHPPAGVRCVHPSGTGASRGTATGGTQSRHTRGDAATARGHRTSGDAGATERIVVTGAVGAEPRLDGRRVPIDD